MTCTCGHHEHAHAQDVGMCGSPHGCHCVRFVKAPAVHDGLSMSIDHDKAKQDAEWLAGSEADTGERNLARSYLALKDEVAGFEAMWEAREKAHDAALGEARGGTREIALEAASNAVTAYRAGRDADWPRNWEGTNAIADAVVARVERLAKALQVSPNARVDIQSTPVVCAQIAADLRTLLAALAEARKDSETKREA